MKRLVALLLVLAVCGVATADDIEGNGIPSFTYFQETGILEVGMDGDEDLISWVLPYAGDPATVEYLEIPMSNINGGWSNKTADGFIQQANSMQDVRIGRIRKLEIIDGEIVETFSLDNEQVFQVAQMPVGLTYADFPGLGLGIAELPYGGEGPIGDFEGTTEYTTLEIVGGVIPEPSMIVLLACGGLGLLVTAIRRRRS